MARSKELADKARTHAAGDDHFRATRETIESIAVAIILAFLFRAFVAEAFVIPTGSMAPTLQGRHMDVECAKCSYRYRTGASVENDRSDDVVATTCPICRYKMDLQKDRDPNQRSFNGDRILVSKFAYEFGDPERWDVIVFKFPGNAKQNYIKRLVGLPNERLWILHGDIYHRPLNGAAAVSADPTGDASLDGEEGYVILRKPPDKLRAMLQLVDDTRYRAAEFEAAGWPARWQQWSGEGPRSWESASEREGFEASGEGDGVSWLRYRHVLADELDWTDVRDGRQPQPLLNRALPGQLITDYYAYNDGEERSKRGGRGSERLNALGLHWVGDLAIEAEVDFRSQQGHLLLDLVESGVHYTCRLDAATGAAELSIDGGSGVFVADDRGSVKHPSATTPIRGPGTHQLRFSNCDDQLLLWVDGEVMSFDGPTTYASNRNTRPAWSPEDAGDLEPAGIGSEGANVKVARLRLLRDVYYVACKFGYHTQDDYLLLNGADREQYIFDVMKDPQRWATTELFASRRRDVRFTLGDQEFFPLGDNSPQSRDARLWSRGDANGGAPYPEPYVARDLLIGKALLIYWPHAWRRPIPFLPNFGRMGLIR